MTNEDYQALGTVIAAAVKKSTAPLLARIAELEARALIPGPAGERGEAGDKGEPGDSVIGERGPAGKDGSSFCCGLGPPTLEGCAGDVYLDAKTGEIYQCR